MLTDKKIAEIAKPFIHLCGDHWICENAIAEEFIEDFAREIEKAVIAEETKNNTKEK